MNIAEHLAFARDAWNEKVLKARPDRVAWDTDIDSHDAGRTRCLRPLVKGIPFERDWRVLEIGCGGARLLERIARCVPDGEAIGYDMSRKMLRTAIRRFMRAEGAAHRFILGDGLTIPADEKVRPHSVDFTFSVLTFQHNPPEVWRSLLVDAAKLARPGGWLRIQLRHNPEDTGLPLSFPISPQAAVKVVGGAGWERVTVRRGWREVKWYWITARKEEGE